jgi:hypothetical protein
MLPHPVKPTRPHLTREDVLEVREVADVLHMPLSTIFDYARRGVLPGHKLGRRWIFLPRAGRRGAHGAVLNGHHVSTTTSCFAAPTRCKNNPQVVPDGGTLDRSRAAAALVRVRKPRGLQGCC